MIGYNICVPNQQGDGWISIENRYLGQEVNTGDYIELSKDEVEVLKCSYVKVVGRMIQKEGYPILYCKAVKLPYTELKEKTLI